MRHPFVALSALFLAASAYSQCSLLAVSGTVNPGDTVVVAVAGAAPNSATLLVAGPHPGSTTIDLGPLGSVTIGLAQPFSIVPIGVTNDEGSLSFSSTFP